MIWLDIDTEVTLPVNTLPLIDDTDFVTRETAIVWNEAGMDIVWNFTTINGVFSQTAITPSAAGDYLWTNEGDGIYSVVVPASGGASINNDAIGFGWFTGICTGVLAWASPIYGFRDGELNDSLIEDGNPLALEATVEGLRAIIRQYSSIVSRNISCNQIELRRSANFEWEVFGIGDLTGRSSLYFTVKYMKEKDSATDAQAVIQIEETAGLLYINKNAASVPANGSITVTDELAGTMTIELTAEETDKLSPNESYLYDIKCDNVVLAEGKLFVLSSITRTVA